MENIRRSEALCFREELPLSLQVLVGGFSRWASLPLDYLLAKKLTKVMLTELML